MASLDDQLRDALRAHLKRAGLSGRRFGMGALRDPGFVASLMKGRRTGLATADSVLGAMGLAPIGPAFRREVEAFLGATGTKAYVLGEAVISRARDRGELVTDDKAALRETLEAVTGERIAALEAVEPERAKDRAAGLDADRSAGRDGGASDWRQAERSSGPDMEEARTPKSVDRDLGL